MSRAHIIMLAGCLLATTACTPPTRDGSARPPKAAQKSPSADEVKLVDHWGTRQEAWGTAAGKQVDLYTLTNRNGLVAKITSWGATLTQLEVPDKDGKVDDVVLGFGSLEGYLRGDGKQANPAYFGGIIGRYCNRIGGGEFKLYGSAFTLAKNNGDNHLHGGIKGFDKQVWKSDILDRDDGPAVKFTLASPDGDEGYPGLVHAEVTYLLGNDNALRIQYRAGTDKPTQLSLTNHSYFNLAGEGKGTVLDHQVQIAAERYTVFGPGDIPTGEIKPVEGTPLDFRKSTRIGDRIDQLQGKPGGYDHNYVLRDRKVAEPERAASIYEPKTGRTLDISTTEVGAQFYTGNYLDGTLAGKRGAKYEKHAGFCLEPQFHPDSPNKPSFPSAILKPGETYRQVTVYKFGVKK